MDKNELLTKLETLREDLLSASSSTKTLIDLLSKSNDDRYELLRDAYFNEHAPVKVMDTEFKIRSKGDASAELSRISTDFDKYLRNIQNELIRKIDQHYEAVELFSAMLKLPMPFSQILYCRFYKRMTSKETYMLLYLSRSTFYRLFYKSLDLLLEAINQKEEMQPA